MYVFEYDAPNGDGRQGRILRVADGRPREHANIVNEIDDRGTGGDDITVGCGVEKRFENDHVLAPLDTHRSAVHLVVVTHGRDDGFHDHFSLLTFPFNF